MTAHRDEMPARASRPCAAVRSADPALPFRSVVANTPGSAATKRRDRTGNADRPTVLLVEDDRDTQNLIRLALRRTCRVVVASDGREARAELASRPKVGLILMDVRLPGEEDGLTLTRSLRCARRWTRVPIIAATACVQPDDLIRAVSSGCNGILAKPFSIRQLRDVVERYLSG